MDQRYTELLFELADALREAGPGDVAGLGGAGEVALPGERALGNLAAADLSQITRAVKCKLRMLQYRPEVINGCLAGTGLVREA